MGEVSAVARVTARALTACAVLLGLVFMHSLGPAMGTGCSGGTAPMNPAAAPAAGHQALMAETTSTAPGPALLATTPHLGGHGAVCVSTPPRGELAAPAAPSATALTEPIVLGQSNLGMPRVGGAVPRAGPALLISLCVSRT
ncbi:hypothetical protein [Actinokineospora inagensis]|uniref:hypothetical protein n=1 Tax=Actinokineospora inagensis TaxID=103730 RepID=UPI0003FC49A0|nr:hypothetical protein [Actinokineospora inagensis]